MQPETMSKMQYLVNVSRCNVVLDNNAKIKVGGSIPIMPDQRYVLDMPGTRVLLSEGILELRDTPPATGRFTMKPIKQQDDGTLLEMDRQVQHTQANLPSDQELASILNQIADKVPRIPMPNQKIDVNKVVSQQVVENAQPVDMSKATFAPIKNKTVEDNASSIDDIVEQTVRSI